MAGIENRINKKVFKINKHKFKRTLDTDQQKFPTKKDNATNEQ